MAARGEARLLPFPKARPRASIKIERDDMVSLLNTRGDEDEAGVVVPLWIRVEGLPIGKCRERFRHSP